MKKIIVLLSIMAVLFPLAAYPDESKISSIVDKIMGKNKDDSSNGDEAAQSNKKRKYLIRLKNGGKIETDNYEILKDSVRIILPAGAIVLEQAEIKDIQEMHTDEGVTVQKIFQTEGGGGGGKVPSAGGELRFMSAPAAPAPSTVTDNEGHNEEYWRARLDEWKSKYDDAVAKYKAATDDWNRYNGLVEVVGPSASQYQVTQYQDLRGSARVRMDEAQAQMDQADKMLNQTIPEEARKAGAPPGWVR